MTTTIHKISVIPHNLETLERLLSLLNQVTEYDSFAIWEEKDVIWSENIRWDDCEENIKKLSKEFPDILITVHGEGEESGDIWEFYCKNQKGYTQAAIISFPPFDENKME